MTDDDWVKAAMADDSIVGHLLLHLNPTFLPPPPSLKLNTPSPALPLDWSVRQRRSRTTILPNNFPILTRASPTTPLSWSSATSGSGGGGSAAPGGLITVDGFEESSRSPTKRCYALSRSKVIGSGSCEATSSKKPRKKKTLKELKVDEDSLLKEKKYLNRKLECIRVTLEKQRTENESLKRIKLELSLQSEDKIVTTVANFPKPLQSRSPLESLKEAVVNQMNSFVLPDLNVAVEEEFS